MGKSLRVSAMEFLHKKTALEICTDIGLALGLVHQFNSGANKTDDFVSNFPP